MSERELTAWHTHPYMGKAINRFSLQNIARVPTLPGHELWDCCSAPGKQYLQLHQPDDESVPSVLPSLPAGGLTL